MFRPPEVEQRKEIHSILEMLSDYPDERERYRQIRKLNYLVTKMNAESRRHVLLDMDQVYYDRVVEAVSLSGSRI